MCQVNPSELRAKTEKGKEMVEEEPAEEELEEELEEEPEG